MSTTDLASDFAARGPLDFAARGPFDFAARGPWAVGVLETEIASPGDPLDAERHLPCEVWYPAAEGEVARDDASHPLGLTHQATHGLAPHSAPCPLIAFSHGNSGLRQQSTFLTTHLASWGFVVAAPDHLGNTFSEMIELPDEKARREVHLRARAQRPSDLSAVIRTIVDEGHERHALPGVRQDSIGVLGHSYGAWTTLKMAAIDPRIASLCCLAPVSEVFVGRRAFEAGELPLPESVASLVIAAKDDVLVDFDTSILPLFERLGPSAELEVLDRADHFHFCDGLELLHKMHENTPRSGLPRPPRPLAELRSQGDTHTWLNERVTRFYRGTLRATGGNAT